MKKTVKSITNLFGEHINLDALDIMFVGNDYVMAKQKGYGFIKMYGPADGYTVEVEQN